MNRTYKVGGSSHADFVRRTYALTGGVTGLLCVTMLPTARAAAWKLPTASVAQFLLGVTLLLPVLIAVLALAGTLVAGWRNADLPTSFAWIIYFVGWLYLAVYWAVAIILSFNALHSSKSDLAQIANVFVMVSPVVPLMAVAFMPLRWGKWAVLLASPGLFFAGWLEAGPLSDLAWQRTTYYVLFLLVLIYALSWVLDRAEQLDEAELVQAKNAAALVTERAATLGRRRAEDFVHDEILSALILVSRGQLSTERAADIARQVLTKLEGSERERLPGSASELLDWVRAESEQWLGRVSVDGQVEVDRFLPVGVAQALMAAVREAVRNSIEHAETSTRKVRREVRVNSAVDTLRIEVWDDGVGFDPGLARDRHGLKNSIMRRAQDSGVRVSLVSRPGVGTLVSFELSSAVNNVVTPLHHAVDAVPRSVLTLLSFSYSMIAAMFHWDDYTLPGVAVATVVALTIATWLATAKGENGASNEGKAWVVAALAVGANLVQLPCVTAGTLVSWQSWATGIGTLLMCVLALRRSSIPAWVGMAGICVAAALAAAVFVGGLSDLFVFLVGHVFLLFLWQLLAAWSERSAHRIAEQNLLRRELEYWMSVEEKVQELLRVTRGQLESRVRPLMDQVIGGHAHDPDVQLESLLIEAELRDELRAPCFTGSGVPARARELRARGLEVVLLDDSDGRLPPWQHTVMVEAVNAALHLASNSGDDGQVVVRVLPVSRPTLVVVSQGGTQIVSIPRPLTPMPEAVEARQRTATSKEALSQGREWPLR